MDSKLRKAGWTSHASRHAGPKLAESERLFVLLNPHQDLRKLLRGEKIRTRLNCLRNRFHADPGNAHATPEESTAARCRARHEIHKAVRNLIAWAGAMDHVHGMIHVCRTQQAHGRERFETKRAPAKLLLIDRLPSEVRPNGAVLEEGVLVHGGGLRQPGPALHAAEPRDPGLNFHRQRRAIQRRVAAGVLRKLALRGPRLDSLHAEIEEEVPGRRRQEELHVREHSIMFLNAVNARHY